MNTFPLQTPATSETPCQLKTSAFLHYPQYRSVYTLKHKIKLLYFSPPFLYFHSLRATTTSKITNNTVFLNPCFWHSKGAVLYVHRCNCWHSCRLLQYFCLPSAQTNGKRAVDCNDKPDILNTVENIYHWCKAFGDKTFRYIWFRKNSPFAIEKLRM